MKLRATLPIFLLISLLAMALAGCDNGPAPAAPTPTATAVAGQTQDETTPAATETATDAGTVGATSTTAPQSTSIAATEPASGETQVPTIQSSLSTPTGTIVDAATVVAPATSPDTVPTATSVTATSKGDEVTALQALAQLKGQALRAMPDARLAMLVNSRPGQQKILLGTALGDPNVDEPTPGGLGRNWTLIAVSPSQKRAMAFSTDGSTIDLTAEGTVPDELLANFESPAAAALDLSKLDPAGLTDSDAIAQSVADRRMGGGIGIALFAPEALGIGQMPTPVAGGPSPKLVYELFGTASATQPFIFFDAVTGDIVLDSEQ